MEDNYESQKLTPYQRLKSIMTEGELTDKGSKNLDALLGTKPGLFDKIKSVLLKIDGFIFAKRPKTTNNYSRRR